MNEKRYSLNNFARAIGLRRCLDCKKDIDKSFKYKYKWNLPLCKECRMKLLNKQFRELKEKQ